MKAEGRRQEAEGRRQEARKLILSCFKWQVLLSPRPCVSVSGASSSPSYKDTGEWGFIPLTDIQFPD
ncbi:MAG: hypothetical protein F6K41_11865 [Symploca sp. SIO3E6]|nr:hypothetical protein [Caldora sp. SIO3E6]